MAMTSEHRGIASRHLRTVFNAGAVGSLADGQLLERYRAGRGDDDSAAAFAALVERHGPMVLGVCRDALDNLHDAEDAAQATFLILAKRAGSIRRADSVASWLFGVALKVAAKARAQAARRRAIEQRGAEMKVREAGSEMPPETRSELHAELDRLPERLRAPIVLCHLEGLSNEQAAEQLGLPVRTVQRRLSQGRERLRDRLVRRGVVPAATAGTLAIDSIAEAASASAAWIEATVRGRGRTGGREIRGRGGQGAGGRARERDDGHDARRPADGPRGGRSSSRGPSPRWPVPCSQRGSRPGRSSRNPAAPGPHRRPSPRPGRGSGASWWMSRAGGSRAPRSPRCGPSRPNRS